MVNTLNVDRTAMIVWNMRSASTCHFILIVSLKKNFVEAMRGNVNNVPSVIINISRLVHCLIDTLYQTKKASSFAIAFQCRLSQH